MALLHPPLVNGLQKTLDAQLDVGRTASVALNNTTNIQNKPGVFLVNRIDSSGEALPTSRREYIKYEAVAGNTLTGLTRARGGSTDQDHAVGSVVEFVSDVTQQQAILDTIEAEHNEDGTHSISDMITGGSVLDEDDMASDSDTALATQQSIKAYTDAQDTGGWTAITETFTYASATTITIAAGGASRFQKGDKLKLTQTTDKYFYIVDVADELLTVTGGSDYTLADAAITSPQLSRIENPFGFPGWFNYVPTFTGWADPVTGYVAQFKLNNDVCHTIIRMTANTTSNSSSSTITSPITSLNLTNGLWIGTPLSAVSGTQSTTADTVLILTNSNDFILSKAGSSS